MTRTTREPWSFIYTVISVFLIILLLMQIMFLSAIQSKRPVGPEFYRVNLLVIDLSIIVIVELILIWVFFRHTLVSISLGTIILIGIIVAGRKPLLRERLWGILTPLVTNDYASLAISDAIFLLVVNALILSFVLTVVLKETPVGQGVTTPKASAPSVPMPPQPASSPGPEPQRQQALVPDDKSTDDPPT